MTDRFLFDVDGVCADFMGHLLEKLEAELGYSPIKYDEVVSHDFLSNDSPLKPDEVRVARSIVAKEGFGLGLPLIPRAKEVIKEIHDLGFEVKFVTAPSYYAKTWCHDRYLWLKENFPFINVDDALILAKDKSVVDGAFLLDDKISNVTSWMAARRSGMGFVYPQPWNRSGSSGFVVADWQKVSEYAKSISKKRKIGIHCE